MRNVSDKSCSENQNTRFLSSNFSFSENRAVCDIKWKNILKPGGQQTTIWRMRFACWIPKAINTHSEYVIRNAFPPQQWLHEHASMLRKLSVLFYRHMLCIFLYILWKFGVGRCHRSVWDLLMHNEVYFVRLYGHETSSFILIECALTVFENGVPREIFRPQKE